MKSWFESLSKESQKKVRVVILTVLVFILSILTYIPFGEDLENLSYDLLTERFGGKIDGPDPRVELILIDEASMEFGQALGLGRWPWPRKIYPLATKFLNSGEEKPAAIFFDILFSESERAILPTIIDPLIAANFDLSSDQFSSDEVFALGVQRGGNIVHNMLLRPDELEQPLPLPGDILMKHLMDIEDEERIPETAKAQTENYTVPIHCLRLNVPCDLEVDDTAAGDLETSAQALAVASFKSDEDGIYRRGRLLFNYDGYYLPSLTIHALQALQKNEAGKIDAPVKMLSSRKIAVGDFKVPVDKKGNYLVNYYRNRIEPKSMSGILLSALALDPVGQQMFGFSPEDAIFTPDMFANKVIIIGVSAVGGQDLKPTPVSPTFPGPEIHANLISNILQNNDIRIEPLWVTIIVLLIGIMTVALATMTGKNPFIQFGVPFIIILVYIGGAVFAFRYFNYLMQFSWVSISAILGNLLAFGYLSLTEGAEKRKYSKVLGNMVDPSIVSEALKDLEALKKGGEEEITAFFSDVAGFSTISEKLDSTGLASLLNEYLSAMTLILKEHHGTLDKYIGDAIVGIFGAPLHRESHPHEAAQSSLDMMRELAILRDYWTSNNLYCPEAQQMEVRIGLNTGRAKVGFMGTDTLASYTMMGDTVNLAARLEAAAKDYGVNILISESFESRVNDKFITRKLDLVRVKGKSEPVTLYELVAEKGSLTDKQMSLLDEFSRGVESYLAKDFQSCIDLLNDYQKQKGSKDKAAMQLIERSEEYLKDPPPEHWDGVFTRTHK